MSVPSSIAAGASWRGAVAHRRKSDCYMGARRSSHLAYPDLPTRRSRGASIFELSNSPSSPGQYQQHHHLRLPGHESAQYGRHRRHSGDVLDCRRHSPSLASSGSSSRRQSQAQASVGESQASYSSDVTDSHHHHHHHHHHDKNHSRKRSSATENAILSSKTSKHGQKSSSDGGGRRRSKRSRSLCLLLLLGIFF